MNSIFLTLTTFGLLITTNFSLSHCSLVFPNFLPINLPLLLLCLYVYHTNYDNIDMLGQELLHTPQAGSDESLFCHSSCFSKCFHVPFSNMWPKRYVYIYELCLIFHSFKFIFTVHLYIRWLTLRLSEQKWCSSQFIKMHMRRWSSKGDIITYL